MYPDHVSASTAENRNPVSWDEYRSWPEDEHWQIIGGEAYAMTPAPATRHQLLVSRLTQQVGNFLQGKPCEVYPAPTDLKLSDMDIVQPDLMVVCETEPEERIDVVRERRPPYPVSG